MAKKERTKPTIDCSGRDVVLFLRTIIWFGGGTYFFYFNTFRLYLHSNKYSFAFVGVDTVEVAWLNLVFFCGISLVP